MKKILFLWTFLIVAAFGQTFKKCTFKLDESKLFGDDFSEKTLYKVIGKPYPPFYTPWRDDPTFDDHELPRYEALLRDYFHALGYYLVEISSSVLEDAIEIRITKNAPITISSITVWPTEGLARYLPVKKGDVFTTEGFTQSKKMLERKMVEEGYPRYAFDAKAFVDLDLYEVRLDFHADKNESVFLDDTHIEGRDDVKEEIIQEAITYKKGDRYDIRKLEETYDKIYEYGIYNYISVEPKLDFNGTTVPVDIRLKMGDTKFIKNSFGYNTDTGPRGGLSWIDKNFYGNLKVFDIGLNVSSLGYEAYNIFYNPRIMLPMIGKINFKNEINYHEMDYESYEERGLVNRMTFGKTLFGLEHYVGLLTESSRIVSKIDSLEEESGNYFINSLFYRLLIDKRDSQVNAKHGYYASFYLERSDGAIGSDLDYLKSLVEFRAITSTLERDRLTFAFKTQIGSIDVDVPAFKRFYTGGLVTNRGYEFQEVGLKDAKGVPRGGVTLIDLLGEVRYDLFSKFEIAGFYDTSMLSLSPHTYDDTFYGSWGFGMRYLTPIGPFRVDFGFPVREEGWTFHVSIGQLF